jgi:hypothetical protein
LEETKAENAEAEAVLESYVKLGSLESLKAIVESANKLKNEAREQKLAELTKHYSVKKGITLESVKKIIDSSKTVKDAKVILESLPNAKTNQGLYIRESVEKGTNPEVTPEFTSFAESMISKMETRRTKSYTN